MLSHNIVIINVFSLFVPIHCIPPFSLRRSSRCRGHLQQPFLALGMKMPGIRNWQLETTRFFHHFHLAVCQNLVPLVNIKIAGKWMFIPLKIVLIGIDPYTFYTTKTIRKAWQTHQAPDRAKHLETPQGQTTPATTGRRKKKQPQYHSVGWIVVTLR